MCHRAGRDRYARTVGWLVWRGIPLAALLLSLIVGYRFASACTCEPTDASAEFAMADAVFSGGVVAVHEPVERLHFQATFPFVAFGSDPQDALRVTFWVSRVWKGPLRQTMVLLLRGPVTEQCSVALDQDAEYLVYAVVEGDQVTARECGRVVSLADAGDDLVLIGSGTVPSVSSIGSTERADSTRRSILLGTIAGLMILLVAMALRVRHRRRALNR